MQRRALIVISIMVFFNCRLWGMEAVVVPAESIDSAIQGTYLHVGSLIIPKAHLAQNFASRFDRAKMEPILAELPHEVIDLIQQVVTNYQVFRKQCGDVTKLESFFITSLNNIIKNRPNAPAILEGLIVMLWQLDIPENLLHYTTDLYNKAQGKVKFFRDVLEAKGWPAGLIRFYSQKLLVNEEVPSLTWKEWFNQPWFSRANQQNVIIEIITLDRHSYFIQRSALLEGVLGNPNNQMVIELPLAEFLNIIALVREYRAMTLLEMEVDDIHLYLLNEHEEALSQGVVFEQRQTYAEVLSHFALPERHRIADSLRAAIHAHRNEQGPLSREQIGGVIQFLSEQDLPQKTITKLARLLAQRSHFNILEDLNRAVAVENMRSIVTGNSISPDMFSPPSFDRPLPPRPAIVDLFKMYLSDEIEPTAESKRRMALTFLQTRTPHALQQEVLDERSWKDLELFCGQPAHLSEYLAAHIPTLTDIGHVYLMRDIADCTTSIKALNHKQSCMRILQESPEFYPLIGAFNKLAEAEAGVFSFWDNRSYLLQTFDEFIFSLGTAGTVLDFVQATKALECGTKVCNWLNTNSSAIELMERYAQAQVAGGAAFGLGAQVVGIGSSFATGNLVSGSLASLTMLRDLPQVFEGVSGALVTKACLRICLRIKLSRVAQYFNAVDEIRNILLRINQNNLFDDVIEALTFERRSEPIQKLRNKLRFHEFHSTNCFPKNSAQSLNIYRYCTGRIISACDLMRKFKNDLVPMISALAELDVLISSARLVKESVGKPSAFCFPDYVEVSQYPLISIEGSWNPFLARSVGTTAQNNGIILPRHALNSYFESAAKVVPNNLEVLSSPHTPATVIINGPNAGGKSSIMKGIIFALILAQGIGIAPAQQLRFTPFSKIQAYLNITDDQVGGKSLFKAAVERAFEVYKKVENMPANCFSLCMFDEIFNGTSSLEGEAAAYTIIEKLGNMPHNITLGTTHFKSLISLEALNGERFVNYMVKANVVDGKLVGYPFTLEKGISNQHIAFNILQNEGFDEEFLNRCREVLRNLELSRHDDH